MKPSRKIAFCSIPFVLALLLLSCSKDNLVYLDETAPLKDKSSVFPLYLSNEWAYVDSFQYGLYWKTKLLVRSVSGFTQEGNTTWWGMSPWGEYSVDNQGVHVRAVGFSPTLMYAFPKSTTDTVVYLGKTQYSLTVDTVRAYYLDHALTVPAGTFDSVVVFTAKGFIGVTTREYFRPRLGLLAYDVYSDSVRYLSGRLVYLRLVP